MLRSRHGPISFPTALAPGDAIAVLAPASPFSCEQLDRSLAIVQAAGYRPEPGASLRQRHGYLAGSDAERAQDLIEALTSPRISAVICARGGYGSSRLLGRIPFRSLRNAPKIFLGFSDITFLHGALNRQAGWVTFHGPNLVNSSDNPDEIRSALEALSGNRPFRWTLSDAQVLRAGSAGGPVVGGNLTCLVHLIGTPYFPNLDGSLLLLEDRGEALYRLDRLINHLKMVGAFDRLAGLLLGQFSDCGSQEQVIEMIAEHLKPFDFPMVFDLPFGHTPINQIIPFGAPLALNTRDHSLYASKAPFQNLQRVA